jgi:GH24 family phage-related lysozyme (muramidase)
MQNFDNVYDQLLTESIRDIISTPKALLAAALILGVIDANYTIPKLSEISNKVSAAMRFKTPESVQQIQQKVVQQQNSPKVIELFKKITKIIPPAPAPAIAKADEFLKKAMKYIHSNELGNSNVNYRSIYKDHKGYNTIGVGHLVTSAELPIYKDKVLTDEEVLDLFKKDTLSKFKTANRLFPQYKTYKDDLKIALLDGIFRGDVSGSPEAIRLINKGEWKKAAAEFLDSEEYRQSVKDKTGVAPRMYKIAKVIASQSKK